MKKLLLLATVAAGIAGVSSVGQAADLPVKAPMLPPPPPPFSWTGFYLGGNLGATWAERGVRDAFGLDFSRSTDAVFMGGGQVGFNYQFNAFVLGIEWDIDALAGNDTNRVGNGILIGGAPIAVSRAGDRWLSTLAARLGWANDHWLFYAKLGAGEVGVRDITVTNLNTGVSITGGGSRARSGGMIGFGLEYAFTNNWTVKAEYDYIAIKNRSFIIPPGGPILIGGDVFTTNGNNVQAFKVGFNYLFGRFGGSGY
jgi:outer membrane immunogenic protein